MTSVTTKPVASQPATATSPALLDDWFDPIEAGIRERVREFIEEMIREELDGVLARPRYGRRQRAVPVMRRRNPSSAIGTEAASAR
jgi:hypothetical protein